MQLECFVIFLALMNDMRCMRQNAKLEEGGDRLSDARMTLKYNAAEAMRGQNLVAFSSIYLGSSVFGHQTRTFLQIESS
jgi:hypothetical protein